MICKKSLGQMIGTGLILLLLAGCSSTPAAPTPLLPSSTPLPTFTSTPTVTPSPTSSPTSTPVPIPSMPTVQPLVEYSDPIVQITDRQGVVTTVKVDHIDTGDVVLDQEINAWPGYLPLKRADGIHILVEWNKFRRVYATEGGYAVTLANQQEVKGQLEFAMIAADGKRYDLQSISSMVLVGLDKTALQFISFASLNGRRWQLHVLEPADLMFIVVSPFFSFEYPTTQNGVENGSAQALTDFFALEQNGVTRKLSSYDEISTDRGDRITVTANGVETSGTFLPVIDNAGVETFQKEPTPNWYLRAQSVENGLVILLKKPICTLTKIQLR
jgi:hypothetical protein